MTKPSSIQGIVDDLTSDGLKNTQPDNINSPMATYLECVGEEEFDKTNVVYIDKDVHEVISLLKRHKKFSIGNLFSMLGKEFIEKHDSEIKDSISNTNKYLSR